jgi:hypothetical protein
VASAQDEAVVHRQDVALAVLAIIGAAVAVLFWVL